MNIVISFIIISSISQICKLKKKNYLFFIKNQFYFFLKVYTSRLPGKLTNEKKLIKHLRESYPVKWGRPVLDINQTLFISVGITLTQILELDANSQSLVTNIWSKYVRIKLQRVIFKL
jgi:hypothetical protein